MDISSVTSSAVQASQATKRTQETQNRELNSKEPEVKKSTETENKPVINTQGQTTGRLLNVTA
ncbi:MAG: hypothetical protein KBF98_01050 [Rhodoferax sp.]|jgi:hypothetical protein|nr:hypothetical protein [Rhodoferax sp.]MBP9058883.1 hypothetical protein [Rhodoferax sp.]MBP9683654.1 hypothetical protein [Rhodoferax sp.]